MNQESRISSLTTACALALILALALGSSGCGAVTCSKICDACANGSESCEEECEDNYSDGDADCRSAMRDLADCVDDDGCDELSCVGDAVDVANECD